jgi:DNA (cytosine-5)-methyltransferase 1
MVSWALAFRNVWVAMRAEKKIPVVDLFAGAGGLSEGFSKFEIHNESPFDVVLSIEKEPISCDTLRIRKYTNYIKNDQELVSAFLNKELTEQEFLDERPRESSLASSRVWNCILGEANTAVVTRKVRSSVGDHRKPWVLIGGPPCQAYSLVGRSRMKSTNANFSNDERHFLYREYLEIVARSSPAVFVMENVKGILSSNSTGIAIFSKILDDLRSPAHALSIKRNRGLRYRLYGLSSQMISDFHSGFGKVDDFLLRSENYGIPQARHRVFILGIREDLDVKPRPLECQSKQIILPEIFYDLPEIRSRRSDGQDSWSSWIHTLTHAVSAKWQRSHVGTNIEDVHQRALQVISSLQRGAPLESYSRGYRKNIQLSSPWKSWFRGNAPPLTEHESRSHMESDLARYLFAACYAEVRGKSPDLRDFPSHLLPDHKNVDEAIGGSLFNDRFRVQLSSRPATTITSHIAKDGHYFIHYDPSQARSFSVREAARAQTFPDDYFLAGNRTQKYHQIGNAVPPLLAMSIAEVVYEVMAAI